MTNFITKEVRVEVQQIMANSACGRFISLSNGRVLDSMLYPVSSRFNDFLAGQYLVTLLPNLRVIMEKKEVDALLIIPQSDLDIDEIESSITDTEFLTTGMLTLCVISVGDAVRFTGEFHADLTVDIAEDERRSCAYAQALTKLIQHETLHRANQVQLLEGEADAKRI